MNDPIFQSVFNALEKGERRLKIGGLWGAARAFFASSAAAAAQGPLIAVTPSEERAEELFKELVYFTGKAHRGFLRHFPAWDIFPYEPSSPRPDRVAERIEVLYRLDQGEPLRIVTSIEALFQRVISPRGLRERVVSLQQGDKLSREDLTKKLQDGGYEFSTGVEAYGQASLRGGILDLFSPFADHPVRLEFFGDAIESIRAFDPLTQKSIRPLSSARVLPGREDLRQPIYTTARVYDYIPLSALWLFEEPQQMEQRIKQFLDEAREAHAFSASHKGGMPAPEKLYLGWNSILEEREKRGYIDLESLILSGTPEVPRLTFDSQTPKTLGFGLREAFEKTAERLSALRQEHRITLTVRTVHQMERVKGLLSDHELPWTTEEADSGAGGRPAEISPLRLSVADLSEGFHLPGGHLLYLTEEELFGKGQTRHRTQSKSLSSWTGSFQDMRINDPVVHIHYGIGRYTGLQRLSISGNSSDFLVLEFSGGDKVYVPLESLDLVQKYIGPEGMAPRLDRLGGNRWKKTCRRIKTELHDMTQELLQLYAQREVAQAHPFSPEGPLFEEFAAAFEYEETPDQLRAIEEVLKNMESTSPMDRLVCGDVGYGKTEVAMRAAFKAVTDGKQVAMVVPTTLLAQQHYQTFTRRFSRFPVKVEVLSRFRPPREQKAVLAGLARGEVDILIGTHRLLQKDVVFHDLGLLVIDEEHRFGVTHKERLKQLRKEIHVLTLTATPIPRTLQMSLAGLRDLSTIETPPADRLAVRTILSPFDRGIIREAILRELARGGQIFFVQNRVHNIETTGRFLSELVPEAAIAVAHGQMRERQLEEVMLKFVNGTFNLLLTTTIIESGLDIPSANTILINNADRFGLAELYQLRGRVGRSGDQAYAYLLVREGAILTEQARARLRAIQEFTELGSGFRIAARDLEIRGAGDLLGRKQSGHVAAVGFELYLQMIEEAASELQGKVSPRKIEPQLILPISAFIPEEYIPDPRQRLSIYKRLASLREGAEIDLLHEELRDRYGPPPDPATRLFEIMRIKLLCREKWVERLEVGGGRLRVQLDASVQIEEPKVERLLSDFRRQIRFLSPYSFELPLGREDWKGLTGEIERCLSAL